MANWLSSIVKAAWEDFQDVWGRPYRVGFEAVFIDRKSPRAYVPGNPNPIPQTKISRGHVIVDSCHSKLEARRKAMEQLEQTYNEEFVNISFFNTKPLPRNYMPRALECLLSLRR